MRRARLALPLLLTALAWLPGVALAADQLNAYSIWPENWARPMLQEFEQATGIKVNFVRFSPGEALARVIAEKGNPQVDVLFGGPVETFAAGIKEGIFEPYKPPSFGSLPARFWGVLRAPTEEETVVVTRISNPMARYVYLRVEGVDPFTGRRTAVVEGVPPRGR